MDSTRSAVRNVDRRVAAAIGREARLELAFELRGERTVLVHGYAEPPFRIGRSFDLDGAAYVILACAGPGVFGGDALHQSVRVGRGARVVLTSQSALQVHPAPAAPLSDRPDLTGPPDAPALAARVRQEYAVEPDGELHCQWDAVIPFAGAQLDQRIDLAIAPSSRLFWADATMAGRVARREAWQFQKIAHELRLRIGPVLAYLERYTLAPADRDILQPWRCGGAPFIATSLAHHERVTVESAEMLHRELTGIGGVRGAADLVAPGLLLARFLAGNGAPFGRARASYRALVLRSIFGRPELAGRK